MNNNLNKLVEEIYDNSEWLSTAEENEVYCIGIENLEVLLQKYISPNIKLNKE